MADITNAQKDKVRALAEEFRDAALRNIEDAEGMRGGGPDVADVQAFVAFDTWIKLDEAEQEKKGFRQPRFTPGRR